MAASSSSSAQRSPSPPPPPLAPSSQRPHVQSQEGLAREIANDKEVLVIWRRWINPLKTEHGDRWVEAKWVEAIAGFYRETEEARLDTTDFFHRNGTNLTILREKYKAGPPEYVQPGFKSPHLGERFDLDTCLPALRGLGWRPAALPGGRAETRGSSPSPPPPTPGATTPAGPEPSEAGRVEYHSVHKDASERTRGKVVLIEFWASWCEGCVAAFPVLSLFQKTYASFLQVISINNPHIFTAVNQTNPPTESEATTSREQEWGFLREIFGESWEKRVAEGEDRVEDGVVDPLSFGVWEDPEGRVTNDVFRRVAVPYIPNSFIFIDNRLFWQGEPDISDPLVGFAKAVEEAVEIVGGVREEPDWFRLKAANQGGG